MTKQDLELKGGPDLLTARLLARQMAQHAGLGIMDQTRFATAVSELVRNALTYAKGGHCELQDLSDKAHVRMQAMVSDHGPGIADLDLALSDGYSSSGSLGAGLPGTKRLVDDFRIESSQAGTTVRIQLIRHRRVR